MYADYVNAAEERNLQLEEALAAARQEVSLSQTLQSDRPAAMH